MLKTLATTSLLAAILTALSAPSYADLPGRSRHWDKGFTPWDVAHQRFDRRFYGPNRGWNRRHWNNRHWNSWYWNNRQWNRRHWNRWNWNHPYDPRWRRWGHRPYGVWGPGWGNSWSGAALGSAITFGLANEARDQRLRDLREDQQRAVTRCYRIERGSDGRERRVELPVSECR